MVFEVLGVIMIELSVPVQLKKRYRILTLLDYMI